MVYLNADFLQSMPTALCGMCPTLGLLAGLDNRAMALLHRSLGLLTLAALGACAPPLDWRETQPESAGIWVMFPCRPDRYARAVVVAGSTVRMEMLVCAAGGATYALSFFDVAEPTGVTPALSDLRALAVANLGGAEPRWAPTQVSGMTPNAQTARLSVAGRLPNGAPVLEEAAFFARGLRVYQASMIGAKLTSEATETFFAGLRLPV